MQQSSHPLGEDRFDGIWFAMLVRHIWRHRGTRISVGTALVLLTWDVIVNGSFTLSFCVCPIWFLVSILKNALQRPGWGIALLRAAIPAVTLGLVMANNAFQLRIAETNASRVIAACEEFRAANGRFPRTLDELVPRYIPSVPRAKYCLTWGDFLYLDLNGSHRLLWYVVPPYLRKDYHFETRQWSYID